MKLFNREKAKNRSFEEITRPKDEVFEENEEAEAEASEENVEENAEPKCEKTVKPSVPFNIGEFNALTCFGWKEDKTDKWLLKCAKVWFLVASFAWFMFGAITFAPVIFISNKVDALFNDRKKSLVCGIAIYVVIVALIVFLFATRGGADASRVVDAETMTEALTTETTEIVKMR